MYWMPTHSFTSRYAYKVQVCISYIVQKYVRVPVSILDLVGL